MARRKPKKAKASPEIQPQVVYEACQAFLRAMPRYKESQMRREDDAEFDSVLDFSDLRTQLAWAGYLILGAAECWRIGEWSFSLEDRKRMCPPQGDADEHERKRRYAIWIAEWEVRWMTGTNALADFLLDVYWHLPSREPDFMDEWGLIRDQLLFYVIECVEHVSVAASQLRAGYPIMRSAIDAIDRKRIADFSRDREKDKQAAWDFMNAAKDKGKVRITDLANHLGCSVGHAQRMTAWREEMARRRKENPPAPRTVSLTDPLQELIADQTKDDKTHRIRTNSRRG